jgi:Tfp pilus assembly protein PilF
VRFNERLNPPFTTATPGDRLSRAAIVAVCLGLTIAVWIVFGKTLGAGFVNYDDNTYVYENPKVTSGVTAGGITWAFNRFYSSNWHPVTWLSHMLDCQFYGLNAGAHHFTSVLLHTITVVLLFLVLWKMTAAVWRSAFVAAVFAIHPLRVESVAWIAERKDVLSGLFFVLTLAAYLSYARSPSLWRNLLVTVVFALGLMSKPMLVTLPIILLLLDWWPLHRWTNRTPSRQLVVEKIPLFALSAASCALTLLAQRSTTASIERLPFSWRVENAGVSYITYIGQMIWPHPLAPFYPHPEDQLAIWKIALSFLLLVAISVAAIHWRKERPYIFTGWFWYVVMLTPVIGVIQVGMQGHADRYTYLPHIGIYIAATWGVCDVVVASRWRSLILTLGGATILSSLAWVTRAQTKYWQDSETLWNHALAVTQDNDIAHNGLGDIFFARGELERAVTEFRAALSLRPDSPYAHNNLGVALTKTGQIDEAIVHLNTAVQTLPTHATAHFNLGNALLQKGQLDAAAVQFEQQLELQPDHVGARCNLGTTYLEKGEVNQAMEEYQKAIKLRPTYADAHYDLGNCYLQKGDAELATHEYEAAIRLAPRMAQARNNLAIILLQQGQLDQAISQWEQVLGFDPDNTDALNNFAWILATSSNPSVRNGSKALQLAKRLDALAPKADAKTLRTMAAIYAANGRFDEAIAAVRQGLQLNPKQANDPFAQVLEADLQLYQNNTAINEPDKMNSASPR